MHAYHEAYLEEIVETQGKLFDEVTEYSPGIDVENFIKKYMASKTREYMELDLAVRKVGEQIGK